MEGRNGAQPGDPPWLILLMLSVPPNPPLKLGYSQIRPSEVGHNFGCFAEAIMAAEGEEGPRLGTTHPYLGPFVRCFNKQIIYLKTSDLSFHFVKYVQLSINAPLMRVK